MVKILCSYFIRGNVASSKNSKRIVKKGKFRSLIDSAASMTYKSNSFNDYEDAAIFFKPYMEKLSPPYQFAFTFFRKTNSAFDYVNLAQGPLDQMTKVGIYADDNIRFCKPHFFDGFKVEGDPGLWISLLSGDPLIDLQTAFHQELSGELKNLDHSLLSDFVAKPPTKRKPSKPRKKPSKVKKKG